MYSSISKNAEPENDWANDVKSNPIHISMAISGAKGYYCMGCTKEMQAVKFKNPKHQSYFRHHVIDVDTTKIECVHASKKYREKLAYFYFMRVKQIKVPDLFKYPPKGVEGNPVLLQEAKVIKAHRIDREVVFFEDENGVIHSGKKTNVDERYLWIRPDAVFYDNDDKPILFLEFVVTHKPDIDKINKLQRIGINTVQIIVPKLSEEEIEKSISQVSKVKWTYNEIESNTEYLSISAGSSEGIPSIDEEQRKLFEESYKCRAAQIGNLVRAINRCLASKSYRGVEHLFEQEIQRIENATTGEQARLDEIQRSIEIEIHSELGERREQFDERKQQFQEYYRGLESRYNREKQRIIERRGDVEKDSKFRQQFGGTEDDIRDEVERIERELVIETEDVETRTTLVRDEQERTLSAIASNKTIQENFGESEDSLITRFQQFKETEQGNFRRENDDLDSKINGFEETRRESEFRFREYFKRRHEQIAERINNRDVQGGDELSKRIEKILDVRRLFGSYSDNTETLERYRKGIQFIKSGTWKEWD